MGGHGDVITLGDSSEDEEVRPIVPAPRPPGPKIGISTPPRKGVQVIKLPASDLGPKIQPKPAAPGPRSRTGHNCDSTMKEKINGDTVSEDNDVICLSSDDDDNKLTAPKPKKKDKGSNLRRGQQLDDEQPSTSTASIARSSPVVSNGSSGSELIANGSSSDTPVVIKDETHDEDAQNILQDDDEGKSQRSEVGVHCFSTDAASNIEKLLKVLRLKLSFKDRKRLKSKIWKTYDKLAAEPLDLHNELSKRIALVINHVAENPEVNFWKLLRQLLDQFDANVLRNETFSITYTEDELIKLEKWKEKRKNQLENKLKKYSEIVKKLDEEEVDWDSEDEHNSSFMQRDRTMAQIMKIHNLICTITKSSKLTGRPIQKAISVKNTTMYPEIEKAVESFVNNSGYSEAPEFCEILEVVETSSSESKLHLNESDRKELAKTLHKAVIERRQQLRELDVPLAFPPECDKAQDPAETDPELEAKLQKNDKVAKTIKSVVDEFAEKEKSIPKNDNEEEDVEEDEEEDEDDTSSLLESGACFVTSVEEEEEAAVEAWDEPLLDAEEELEASISEDLRTDETDTTPSLISEAETAIVCENGHNEIEQTEPSFVPNADIEPCEESINKVDEPPPAKKLKADHKLEDVE